MFISDTPFSLPPKTGWYLLSVSMEFISLLKGNMKKCPGKEKEAVLKILQLMYDRMPALLRNITYKSISLHYLNAQTIQ